MQNKTSSRRSATEWSRLVAAWQRSGESAAVFGAGRGVAPGTLEWWRWQLARREREGQTTEKQRRRRRRARRRSSSSREEAPRLVAVELQPASREGAPMETVAWEVESARGDLLRVRTGIAASDLSCVLAAMAIDGRQP
jgi:hypothetical protein